MRKHIKHWKVSGEINMDASRYAKVEIRANTSRKAMILGEEKIKKDFGAFYVTNISVTEIKEEGN